jgi:hypothetical protein
VFCYLKKGVLLFEKGVLLFEKGVLLFEKGVCYLKREFCYFKQPTPTFLSAISAIMFHAKTSQTHDIPTI